MKGVPSPSRAWRVYHLVLSNQKLYFFHPTDDLAKILFNDTERLQVFLFLLLLLFINIIISKKIDHLEKDQ